MTMRICILGSPEGLYVRKLMQAAQQHEAVSLAECRQFTDLQVAIPATPPQISRPPEASRNALSPADRVPSEPTEWMDFDAFLVRTMPLGSLEQVIFRMDCLQVLQDRGAVILNPPRTLELAIDKWLTLHRLERAGVCVPATVACQTRDSALAAFEQLGGDTVVKPLFGGEGRGLMRVQDPDMAWRVFSTLHQLRSVLYVQQFHPHFGYDIRVLFVGQQHFAIRRLCDQDAWRANLALGSKAEEHRLTDQEYRLAREAAQVVGGSVLGVDLLPCQDGLIRVLEVNAVPGWLGLERALGIAIAPLIFSHLHELVTRCRTNPEGSR